MLAELQQRLGNTYSLIREIGGGGMSRVFEAEEMALGRRVVVKVLLPELGASVSHERFRREILVAAQLRHPNLVPVYTAGEVGGWLYYTMPFIEGESLRERLRNTGRLPVIEAVQLTREVAGALEYAHRENVIHRDIKPENIMMERGHAVVTDFGIAVAVRVATQEMLTATGLIVGTPAYMSPEQVAGGTIDARSDIYSLACVLYEMLTGIPPFHGDRTERLLMARLTSPAPAVTRHREEVSPALDRVVRRALSREVNERPSSAAEFGDALGEALRDPALDARTSASRRRPATSGDVPRTMTRRTLSGRTRQIQSIAVLPFANAGGDPEAEYLSDGISESVMNKLSRLSGLRVTARSVAFKYKGQEIDPVAVGKDLKVRAVVTGRVQEVGNRLTVSAELVEVGKARQIWGDQYIKARTDIFEVQDSIATEISAALRVHISGDEHKSLTKRHTENATAYESYMKGQYHWNKRTAGGFQLAAEHFQRAIAIDSDYALAYAGLSDTYNLLGYYNLKPPRETYPRAREAAARALEIDPTLAPAHASLGYEQLFYEREWEAAAQSFRRAIELDPTYASAHQWQAWYYFVTEQFDEAVEALRIAHSLDALSLVINDHLGYSLHRAGDTDEALAQLMRTRELDPAYPLTYWRVGGIRLAQGRVEEAVTEWEQMVRLTQGRFGFGYLGLALALAGRVPEARDQLEQALARRKERFISPLEIALIHAGLGDADATFLELDRADEERVSDMVRVRLLPWPDAIRSDPRFALLTRRLGLTP